jgi:hypothetical protein
MEKFLAVALEGDLRDLLDGIGQGCGEEPIGEDAAPDRSGI